MAYVENGALNNSSSSSTSNNSMANVHDQSNAVVEDATPLTVHPPIVCSYSEKIAPLLDCVDKLRHLKIMQEGIQLPTIVVVGDQSFGKSSVLESLAGISLPRGQGICTRVPLIMRLQTHDNPRAELYLEFNGKTVPTDEKNIATAIDTATDEIAGEGKGISNTPLTLIVKKNGVPNLTMVDLPGITRVPVRGQPEDIYEQISATIMEYITPEESIILNVLDAAVDFSNCESIRMSQKVDKTGERTLAVVTKVDKTPDGLLEKVSSDDVNIGLGYVCVRNRIGNESYEEAREEEAKLFASHPLLSKISKSMVGIPVLAQKLVQIQATIISKCVPDIVKKINDKLGANMAELSKLPQNINSASEATTTFFRILSNAKESMKKILLRGEFDEYPEDKHMHCTARLAEMLNEYRDQLHSISAENDGKEPFLMEEIKLLEDTKGISLPNFLPRTAFLAILQRKVKGISSVPVGFIEKVWNYIEGVILPIWLHHSDNYPLLQSSTRRAAKNLIAKKMDESTQWVMEIIEMEKLTDYTSNPEYVTTWNTLIAQQDQLMKGIGDFFTSTMDLEGFGRIEVGHLSKHLDAVQQAFDLRSRMMAYWKIVQMRFVDTMALHMQHSISNLVNKEMEGEVVSELMAPHSGGIERLLEESPGVAEKRKKLKHNIKLLKDSKDVVSKVMDMIATDGN